MNLLQELSYRLNNTDRHIATITGQRHDGLWVGTTLDNKTVLLTGNAQMSKKVYYDRHSGQILGFAPDVQFETYSV